MNREHNATAAHLDMTAQAERTKVGRTFHQPAPIRVTVRKPGRFVRALYSILLAINF